MKMTFRTSANGLGDSSFGVSGFRGFGQLRFREVDSRSRRWSGRPRGPESLSRLLGSNSMNYAVERAAAREAQLGEPISAKPRGAAPFHVPPTHISENTRRRSSENARNGAAT